MTLSPNSSRGGGTTIPVAATSLPASPATGDLAILTDSTTAPTYQWLCKYDTTIGGTSKWRFVGGDPMFTDVAAPGTIPGTNVTTYSDMSVTQITLTAPVAGNYLISFGGTPFPSVVFTALGYLYLTPKLGAAATVDADGVRVSNFLAGPTGTPVSQNVTSNLQRTISRTLTAAAVKLQARTTVQAGTGIGTWSFENVWLSLTPIVLG